jgi:hypothetical protein
MKHIFKILIALLSALILSCEKSDINYADINEISIPTSSPRGLAFDGNYLWYSDDSSNSLYKISSNGSILKTVRLTNCKLTGFDFCNNSIWCINDNSVFHDTTISPYPSCCIYNITTTGDKIDTILIQGSVNFRKPEFLGLTVCNGILYGSTSQGWSSHLYKIDLETKQRSFLWYYIISGLTSKKDTIYVLDIGHINMSRISHIDSDNQII